MEDQNHPSLPPNYVSLADLQQRWMKQQEDNKREKLKCQPSNLAPIPGDGAQKLHQKRREKEEVQLRQPNLALQHLTVVEDVKAKPQFRKVHSSTTNANPNLHNRKPFRRDYCDRKGSEAYRMVVKSNMEPKPSKIEGAVTVQVEIGGGDQSIDEQVGGEQKSKVEGNIKKKYKNKKKKQKPAAEEQTPARNEECGEERENEEKGGGEAPLKPALSDQKVEVEEKFRKLSVKGRTWRNNGKSTKPARNGECGEEREKEVKADGETPLTPALGYVTVGVDEKFKKVIVNGRGWRSNGNSAKPARNSVCEEERENKVKAGNEAPLKPALGDGRVEVDEKFEKVFVNGRVSNGNSTKPARNSKCEEERENEVKAGNEAPLKPAVGDRKVEVEEKLKKVFVNGRVWRSNGRAAAVIGGPKKTFRAYGRVEHRGMGRTRRENGLVWMKKGEVPEL